MALFKWFVITNHEPIHRSHEYNVKHDTMLHLNNNKRNIYRPYIILHICNTDINVFNTSHSSDITVIFGVTYLCFNEILDSTCMLPRSPNSLLENHEVSKTEINITLQFHFHFQTNNSTYLYMCNWLFIIWSNKTRARPRGVMVRQTISASSESRTS